jgi:hypothetical protein
MRAGPVGQPLSDWITAVRLAPRSSPSSMAVKAVISNDQS